MDKISIEYKTLPSVSFLYKNEMIEMRPYIEINEESMLISNYLQNYFIENEDVNYVDGLGYNVIGAEIILQFAIISMLTNIELESLDTNLLTVDNLFEEISDRITNYEKFRSRLDMCLNAKTRELEMANMLGSKIENIYVRAMEALDSLKNINLSVESIEKMKSVGIEMLREIEKSSASTLFTESKNAKRVRKNAGQKTE